MTPPDDTVAPAAAQWLRRQLQYQPADLSLYAQALTHRSAARANNERLEFLGDAVLNLIVAQHLYAQYPEADEGTLSRLRAAVVSGESLARIATQLDLGAALALGAGIGAGLGAAGPLAARASRRCTAATNALKCASSGGESASSQWTPLR